MSDKAVPERLQKVLAQYGLGSRRSIEAWILEGRILVNGTPAVLGTKVTNADQITVDGQPLTLKPTTVTTTQRIILYHKPLGEICSRSDPEGRPTVFDHLPKLTGQRWVAVGRLDINSSGLLLFTTDGELANKLMHPSANLEREYAVRVLGHVSEQMCRNMLKGVTLDDGTKAKFSALKFVGGTGANAWYHVILHEGRYREVRRIWETQGIQVSRLIRIRYGKIKLPKDLPEGGWLELDYDSF